MQRDFSNYVECRVEVEGKTRSVLIPDRFARVGAPWKVLKPDVFAPSESFDPTEWVQGRVTAVGQATPSELLGSKQKDEARRAVPGYGRPHERGPDGRPVSRGRA